MKISCSNEHILDGLKSDFLWNTSNLGVGPSTLNRILYIHEIKILSSDLSFKFYDEKELNIFRSAAKMMDYRLNNGIFGEDEYYQMDSYQLVISTLNL